MKVKYLYNSGFIIETDRHILVMDSMHKTNVENKNNKKEVYFATHSHMDHYNKFILEKETVVLSDDIKVKEHERKNKIYFVKPYDKLKVDDIKIETFGSTDLGVSYLIEVDGKLIFHSGDLNWWHWENDDKETQENEAVAYEKEIYKLKNVLGGKKLDLAFVPVDRRLGENSTLAINFFLKNIGAKEVFPMHFQGNYRYIKDLEPIKEKFKDINIHIIEEENQEFSI